jgi:uncharacterized protein (DUF2236 family)
METLFKNGAIYGTRCACRPTCGPRRSMASGRTGTRKSRRWTVWIRSLCKDLLHPNHTPIWLKPLSPAARLLTNQWLPETLCEENGLKITNFDRAMYHYIVGYISMAYPHLPRKVRTSLSRYYLKGLKKALKEVRQRECGLGQT